MNILFICTHNRCRSIIAEAVTNHFNHPELKAYSAGSEPSGQVHPLSLKYLEQQGINTDGLKSQSWDEYNDLSIDLAITVCDSAAGESCPLWMGKTSKIHWGLTDPSRIDGSDDEIEQGFLNLITIIQNRIQALIDAKVWQLEPEQYQPLFADIEKQYGNF